MTGCGFYERQQGGQNEHEHVDETKLPRFSLLQVMNSVTLGNLPHLSEPKFLICEMRVMTPPPKTCKGY